MEIETRHPEPTGQSNPVPPPPAVNSHTPEGEAKEADQTSPQQPNPTTTTEEGANAKEQSRARSISPELLLEYGKDFAETLSDYPEDEVDVSLLLIRDKYAVVRNVAKDIFIEANRHVPRYFNPVDDTGQASTTKLPTLTSRGLITGGRYFKEANKIRSKDSKFNEGDKFTVHFHDDEPDKFTMTRVHRAPASNANTEA